MKIIEKELNLITGEETITERDETAQEQAERLEREAKLVEEQTQAQARAAAKAALLERLGITEEEANLLLS